MNSTTITLLTAYRFGNFIGDALDSDLDSENQDQIPRFDASSDSEIEQEEGQNTENQPSNLVVLAEDKQIYPSMAEVFGPDVQTVIQTQDTQDIDQPIVKPVDRKIFQVQEQDLPETLYSKEYMLELSKIPLRVRNVAICGDLHSGKTSLIDVLVLQTHHLENHSDRKPLRYTDIHKLEISKGISIKTTPITLLLPNMNSKSYVINVMDTPGHVNFLDEVSVAQATTDATIICVDVVQSLSHSDKLIIENCLANDIPMAFILNKIDRLILELRLPPQDSYFKIRSVVDEINDFVESRIDSVVYTHSTRFSPELGNVGFASAIYQFCFTLKSFIYTIYGDDSEAFVKRLWGDIYYENRAFTTKPQEKTNNRSFVKFILEPLYKLFNNVLVKPIKELQKFLKHNFQLEIPKEFSKLDSKTLLIKICQVILGNSSGFVDICEMLPSPADSYNKIIKSLNSPDLEFSSLVKLCDFEAPVIARITKLIDTIDSKRFYGLVRVISGTLSNTSTYKVLGENYLEDDENVLSNERLTKLYSSGGRYRIAVDNIYAGNIGLIMSDNLDTFITKTATVLEESLKNETVFKNLNYMTKPIYKIAVEPKKRSDMHKLLEGFGKINKSYVGCEIKVEESGEHVVLGSGELYLDCLLRDLRLLYTDIEIKVSDPLTKFAETCIESSMIKIPVKSLNGLNEISVIIEPLESQILEDVEQEIISMSVPPRKLAKWFRESYDWDSLASRSIWSLGSSSQYANVLLDDTLPDQVDKNKLLQLKSFIVQGFQWAMREGPLCDEPVRGLKLKIIDIKLADEMIDCNGGQIIPMVRNACYAAMLLAQPRLLEPTYRLDVLIKLPSDQDPHQLKLGLDRMLSKRRGNLYANSAIPGTQLYQFEGLVPVLDSVGLETDIRLQTSGQLMCFLSFTKWDVMPGDPMDSHVSLPALKPVPYSSLARDCTLKTRRRKGIAGEPGLEKYIDFEVVQQLKDGGIIE